MGECFNYSHVLQIRVRKEKRERETSGQSYHKHKKPVMKSFTVAVRKGSMQV